MSALTVAAAITALDGAAWVPPIASWEIATADDVWGAHAEIDTKHEGEAYTHFRRVAEVFGTDLADDGRLVTVSFERDGVPFRFWWMRPVLRWAVPERCATCPTELGSPEVQFVRLGDPDGAVICIPCRDLMHAQWATTTCPATADLDDHHWWFSGPDDGWQCTACKTVRTDPADLATMTRAPRVEAGESL